VNLWQIEVSPLVERKNLHASIGGAKNEQILRKNCCRHVLVFSYTAYRHFLGKIERKFAYFNRRGFLGSSMAHL
jgi:hypothetical protein